MRPQREGEAGSRRHGLVPLRTTNWGQSQARPCSRSRLAARAFPVFRTRGPRSAGHHPRLIRPRRAGVQLWRRAFLAKPWPGTKVAARRRISVRFWDPGLRIGPQATLGVQVSWSGSEICARLWNTWKPEICGCSFSGESPWFARQSEKSQ